MTTQRVNGQFDDSDAEYCVEVLRTVSGFNQTWSRERRNVTLRNAELIRRALESKGLEVRVLHQADDR